MSPTLPVHPVSVQCVDTSTSTSQRPDTIVEGSKSPDKGGRTFVFLMCSFIIRRRPSKGSVHMTLSPVNISHNFIFSIRIFSEPSLCFYYKY